MSAVITPGLFSKGLRAFPKMWESDPIILASMLEALDAWELPYSPCWEAPGTLIHIQLGVSKKSGALI